MPREEPARPAAQPTPSRPPSRTPTTPLSLYCGSVLCVCSYGFPNRQNQPILTVTGLEPQHALRTSFLTAQVSIHTPIHPLLYLSPSICLPYLPAYLCIYLLLACRSVHLSVSLSVHVCMYVCIYVCNVFVYVFVYLCIYVSIYLTEVQLHSQLSSFVDIREPPVQAAVAGGGGDDYRSHPPNIAPGYHLIHIGGLCPVVYRSAGVLVCWSACCLCCAADGMSWSPSEPTLV